MKPGQKTIYWIAGMSQEEVARSPFAEKPVAEVWRLVFYIQLLLLYALQCPCGEVAAVCCLRF
jgi:hypothetical protein